MNWMENNKLNKITRRNFLAGLMLILVLALSVTGVTGAWFTDSSVTIENNFTAGTVRIESEPINTAVESEDDVDVISPGEYLQKEYKITNVGTKSIYVRALFDGYLEYGVHKNTATVTATADSVYASTVTDSDVAYYYFNNQLPEPVFGEKDYIGFTNYELLTNEIKINTGSFSSHANLEGNTDNTIKSDSIERATFQSTSINTATGKGVIPEKLNPELNPPLGPDPLPGDLESPCGDLQGFKIDLGEDDFDVGKPKTFHIGDDDTAATDDESTFKVTIVRNEDDTLDFYNANGPVHHVWVKGGNNGYLFSYFNPGGEPHYPNGVVDDSELYSPATEGWSHITFYYCEPPDSPAIEIIKKFSGDGGSSWDEANQSPGSELLYPHKPEFKFIVTNTGDVPLKDIEVTDDIFGLIGNIENLNPGATETLMYKNDSFDWDELLVSVAEIITVELCADMDKWVPEDPQPLGTYFYHTEVIKAEDDGDYAVNLCVKVNLEGNGIDYEDVELVLYSYFEAVQASNYIIEDNWPEEDLSWLVND